MQIDLDRFAVAHVLLAIETAIRQYENHILWFDQASEDETPNVQIVIDAIYLMNRQIAAWELIHTLIKAKVQS